MTDTCREVLELTGESARPSSIDDPVARWLDDTVAAEPAVRILLADDDERARHRLATLLTDAGMKVTEAADGEETIALAAGCAPDVIILDWPMPSGGLPLAQRLIGELGMTGRVIMLATAYDRRDHHAALKAGAHYIVKAPMPERLIPAVRTAAGRSVGM